MVNNPKRKETKNSFKTKLPSNSEIKALIFHSNDKNPKEVKIKNYSDDFFNYKGRSYTIDFEGVMFFKRKKLFWGSIVYLFYHYDNDQPLKIDESMRSINQKRIPNSVIHTALVSEAIKKANDIKNNDFLQDNLLYIIIGGAIMIGAFFMFGG